MEAAKLLEDALHSVEGAEDFERLEMSSDGQEGSWTIKMEDGREYIVTIGPLDNENGA